MNNITTKYYIGYLSGPKCEMYPDIFQHNGHMTVNVGKPWGSYLMVAGPYDSASEARAAIRASLPRSLFSYITSSGGK
jgi:hypothetical protein